MAMFCNCGFLTVLKTYWTELNPGIRFWGCPQYSANGRRGCNFIHWHDSAPCTSCMNVIPGLLRRIDGLELEIERRAKNERKVMVMLLFCVVWILLLLSMKGNGEEGEDGRHMYELQS